jgi:hypothetical protein
MTDKLKWGIHGTAITSKSVRKPLRMKTWDEAREHIRVRLKPAGFTPAGNPCFDEADIATLNILMPDEYE